jgi:hypothetical protein
VSDREFEVGFLRAPLLIRVGISGGASLMARALTLDEARALVRKLSRAIEDGQDYINALPKTEAASG